MNRNELATALSERLDISKAEARTYLDALQDIVVKTVKKGEPVTITGFVKFWRQDVKARKARKGINPFTGEPTTFKAKPATKRPKVTVLKNFKDAIVSKSKR